MRESSLYQAILEEGKQQGLEQALQQGLQAVLLDLATKRFGELPEDVQRIIDAVQDAELLRKAAVMVWDVEDLEELCRLLEDGIPES